MAAPRRARPARVVRLALVLATACAAPGDRSNAGVAADSAGPTGAVTQTPAGKRVAPPEVAPVTIGEIRFEAIHWGRDRGLGQNGGYIAALDRRTGSELWVLKVYDIEYDPSLEEDVQDVFIASLSRTWLGGKLDIRDERGRRYRVDPRTRSVERR
jgi:hypothetical protein